MGSEWNVGTRPPRDGYYLGVWRFGDRWMVSELWFNTDSLGSGWFPIRRYLNVDHGACLMIDVVAWMPMPEYPGPGRIIGYLAGDKVWDPDDVKIVREQATLGG
jgi:hypothetical protein